MKLYQKIGLIAGPIAFLALLLMPTIEGLGVYGQRCLAIVMLMLIWWSTEAVHYGVTSLLPAILFPATGISKALDFNAYSQYGSSTVFLVSSMLMLSAVIVKWNLHKRLALKICLLCGSKPTAIIFGFTLGTGIVSMFLSNTTTTAMMLPIALALIDSVAVDEKSQFHKALILCIPWAAGVGGIGTLLGGATNVTGTGLIAEMTGFEFTFTDWLKVGVPFVAVLLPILAIFVNVVFHVKQDEKSMQLDFIKHEYEELGPMSRGEKTTSIVLVVTILLLITRTFWSSMIPTIADQTLTLLGILTCFVIPVDWKKGEMLLDRKTAHDNFPGAVILLVGASLTVGNAMAVCGVTDWIAGGLGIFSNLSPIVLVFIMALISAVVSEFCTNQVVAAAMCPIVYSFSLALGMNPLILMVAVTVSASFAFALPSGTPPTAIAMGTGKIDLTTMIKYGFLFKLIAVIVFIPVFYFITMGVMGLGA